MTREEYEALLKQKADLESKLGLLDDVAWEILQAKGIKHHGEVTFRRIQDGFAIIRYREPGCSCCPSSETVAVPEAWMFGADFNAEIKRLSDEEARLEAEKELREAAEEKLAQEQRDIEEFDRLKVKFGGPKQ